MQREAIYGVRKGIFIKQLIIKANLFRQFIYVINYTIMQDTTFCSIILIYKLLTGLTLKYSHTWLYSHSKADQQTSRAVQQNK